ncbi:MAG TPA: autotransporter-associated beta strand repeat-containing protein [Verrucomicrobiae bacterium]|jgi:autotransporter-associated beta strand protein
MNPITYAKKFKPMNWLRRRSLPGDRDRSTQTSPFASNHIKLASLAAVALTGGVLLTPAPTHAALMAYEGFNYGTGSANLTGLSGGFGWSGGWQTVNNSSSSVIAGNLTAGANAPTGYDSLSTGNAALTSNGTRTGRWLDTSAGGMFGAHGYINTNGDIGADGKTVYISFMQQPNATSVYYEFELHRNNLSDPGREAGVGNDAGDNNVHFRIENPAGGGSTFSDLGAGNTGVNFYVVRIDFQSGNSTVTVYRNPTSATEPAMPTQQVTAITADLSFDGISLGAFVGSQTVMHDEIRVGETWADVVSPGASSTGLWDGGGANANWSTAGNWDNNAVPVFATSLTFAGNAGLNNNNDLTGVSANNITFDSAAGAFTLAGNSLGLNGNIGFNANPASPITQTINLALTPNADFTIGTRTNGNITINGNLTGVDQLTQTGPDNAGILTLGGNNSLKGLVVNNGTNIITGNTVINGIGGSSFFYVPDTGTSRNGTLIIQNGATLTITNGFQDAGVIARDGANGRIIQNGGTFNFAINDGSHNILFVGASGQPNAHAEYDMNGGLLDMHGDTLGIALGVNAGNIMGVVNQTGGVITNVLNLYFSPFFSTGNGIYNLTGGSIYIGSGGITNFPGGAYQMNLGGGTVGAYANWLSVLNLTLTGTNGPVTFSPNGNTIALSGILSGSGGLTVSGSGILELSGANTYTGDTTVNAGSILQLDATGSSAGAFRVANNGLLNLNFSGNYAVGSFYTNGVALPVGTYNAGNLSSFIAGPGNLQVTSGISVGQWTGLGADNNWSTGGNWDNNSVPIFPHAVTFAGSTQLNNNNDLSGITVGSFTFDSAAGAFTIGGNDIGLSGGISFNGNPSAPITQTINLNMAWNADKTIDTPTNGNLVLGGNITTSGNILTKLDGGILTLGGVDSFGGYILNGGANIITGNVTVNGTGGGDFFYLGANAGYNGTLVIQPGAALTVSGTFGDALVIGRNGGSGKIVQNGGIFTYNCNQQYLFVGATSQSGTQAEYDMNGGVFDMSGFTLGIALGDNGAVYPASLNQTGGSINNVFKLDLGSVRFYGHGIYNLSGGIINIDFGGIVSSSGSYEVNLGGGTISAISPWVSSLNMNLTNFNGSTTFSPNGNTITLSGALSGIGGLIADGGGILELAGTNTYTGDSVITNGTVLQLDVAGTSPGAFRIVDGAFLNLNFGGTLIVPALYTNGVALPNGIYNSSNLGSFLQGSGNVQVAGLAFSSQPQSQLVYLNKGQTATFSSSVVGGAATYQWYLNGNAISGATNSSATLSNLQITNGGNIYVVATGASGSVTSSVVALTVYAVNNNLFAYDGYDYAAGSVDGVSQAGGFGWNGPWQQVDGTGVIITSGSLVGGANVPAGYDARSVGNLIEVPSNAQTRSGRSFDMSSTSELFKQGFVDANGNIGANGKTVYLSFLQQPDRTSGFYELEFHRGSLSDPGRIGGIGNDTGTGNVNLRAPNSVNNRSLGAGTTGVNLYVVRIDFKAGNDDVFVYRNPTSLTEPATPTLTVSNVSDMSFSGVSVAAYNGPDVKTDEVRLGATYADALGLAVSNLLPLTKTANGYKVQFACTPNYSYRVQRATDLTGPWTDLTTNTAPENGYVEFEDTNAPTGRAFYRTVTP